MREIIFRGKRLNNGEWVYGQFTATMHARSFIRPDNICQYDASILYVDDDKWYRGAKIDEQTVGQYTGLTDIHGKKIFEGDIVKHYNFSVDPEHFSSGVILWNDDACRWERTDTECSERFFISSECKYEVIGNIHDNPELMGGTENVSHP